MKNEDKLKLATINRRNNQSRQAIFDEARALKTYTEQRKTEVEQIRASIEKLAEALQVKVEFPDLSPITDKLKDLENLPDTFQDIKNMSLAVSSKLELMVTHFKKKQIFTVRGVAETNQRLENIDKGIEKFADLATYINQLSETLKQGQKPTDYKPVRLVVGGNGLPLRFLQDMPSSRGGGGGGQTDGLTDTQLRASPVPVEERDGSDSTTSSVSGSASSVTVVAANANRIRATVVNDSSAILYVREGTPASATNFTYKLYQDDTLIVDDYTGILTGIWASATGAARVTELV